MSRRYGYSRRRGSRRNTENRRRRTALMNPVVQISILGVVALVIYLLLQSAGR
jgi:hypothetical protein